MSSNKSEIMAKLNDDFLDVEDDFVVFQSLVLREELDPHEDQNGFFQTQNSFEEWNNHSKSPERYFDLESFPISTWMDLHQ
jgi:hypothetical protein